jgi:phosphoribosylaminoimidazole-succinocarboxamide synthase
MALEKGLILADTKYEFGKKGSDVFLIDEVHTPDSSRYFFADGFHERQEKKERQQQLSKEFVREWLIENNFMGKAGQTIPEMTDEWVAAISGRYIQLYENLTGNKFIPHTLSDEETGKRIVMCIKGLDKIE